MSFPQYNPYPLELIIPDFDSELADLVIGLDHMRRKEIRTATHPRVFRDLLTLFHTIEAVGSARIEGNNTRMIELLDAEQDPGSRIPEGVKEINNMEQALAYIDRIIEDRDLDEEFISEIHRLIMEGLRLPPSGDGDPWPGDYRKEEVGIGGSAHLPPPPWEIKPLMKELISFMEVPHAPKFDLIKASLFHHRFVWIHPFTNGNGRTARMLTYALMIKQGFRVNERRIINPTSAFCMDRKMYYTMLSGADSGKIEELIKWCTYMLGGLHREIEKIDLLADHDFLVKLIILPALSKAEESGRISTGDRLMLKIAAEKGLVSATHFKDLFKGKLPQEISRQIRGLRDKALLIPVAEGGRQYVIHLKAGLLRLGIMQALDQQGFLPAQLPDGTRAV